MLVLDASMTLAWLFEDEESPGSEKVFDIVVESGGIVPSLWWLEVANALRNAVRRSRVDEAYVDRSLARLGELSIATDEQTAQRAWYDTLSLARAEGLTPYDACYLELAIRRNLPLASGDANLVGAAVRRAVPVVAA